MRRAILSVLGVLFASAVASGQVTTSFTYQGELADAGQPATGVYDLRFRLFNLFTGGTQAGPTLCAENVQVVNGRFTVELDFGPVFTGASRFLEIDVRPDVGTLCTAAGGYVALEPRQKLTATPHAAYALTANAANTASLLNNQPPSFYQNAANLTSGTLPDARLSTNVTTLGGAQTFSGVKTFGAAPAFIAAGAPFSVSSSTVVTNLNADLLDGLNSTAFALAGHTHDASAITSGTLADARLASNIPRLGQTNTFTDTQFISVGAQTPLSLAGSNTGGTWFNLQNTGGGRTWNLIATGSANGEGAGRLLVRDQTAGLVRLTLDPTGRLGVGTTAPSSLLELAQADAALRVRNTNDPGGGFVQNTFGTLQFGIYNPTASAWGAVPANSQRSMLGVEHTGRVGTLTNTSGSPVWRNTLDDGSGNATFAGTIAATNLPRAKVVQTYRDIRNLPAGISVGANQSPDIDAISVNVPGPGILILRGSIQLRTWWDSNQAASAYFKLEETTGGPSVVLNETSFGAFAGATTALSTVKNELSVEWSIPVTAGTRTFKTSLYNNSTTSILYYSTSLSAIFIPGGL